MDIKRTLKRFTEQMGPGKSVHSIAPDDFSAYRDTLYETMNSQTVNNNITRIKGLFHWLHKREYIARPQNFGDNFQKAKRRQLRRERRERGAMMFSAHQINDLLACSAPTLRAMILLGINCG
jgi:site-specific recombinase XerD